MNKIENQDYETPLQAILDIYTYEKEDEDTKKIIEEKLEIVSKCSFKLKKQLIPILFGLYVIQNEDYPILSKIILNYIFEEVKSSKQFGHLIILNIFSCKNCYKKHIDMKDLQLLIIQIFSIWEQNNLNENNNCDLRNIYTSIFGVYNNIEQLIKKNLTKLDNIRELYQENGNIKWNKFYLNKKKNEQIKINEKSKKNLKWLQFFSEINFINDIVNISDLLRSVPREMRESSLREFILLLNKEFLPSKIYNPLSFLDEHKDSILLKIDETFSYPISTNERVPCQILFEYSIEIPNENQQTNNNESEKNIDDIEIINKNDNIKKVKKQPLIIKPPPNIIKPRVNTPKNSKPKANLITPIPNIKIRHSVQGRNIYSNYSETMISPESAGIFNKYSFEEVKEKILNNSKYNKNPNYIERQVISSIIKGGDELRQDYFISQIINLFNDFFHEDGLNIHLKTFNVISNCSGGFLQTIIDSVSLSKINKIQFPYEDKYSFEYVSRIDKNNLNNNESNLKNYFIFKFGNTSIKYEKAINNFITSFVGYSLICYFFEIKDRNNGNILIDDEGNVIHIDFGFLLDKTPGNIKFEKAPFKFTSDFIELIGGTESKYFILFQDLFFKGFKIIRKKYDIIILMVELFCDIYHDLNSFRDKDNILKILKEKFLLAICNENDLMKKCNELIYNSIDNWRTKAYDIFQYFCVGVN